MVVRRGSILNVALGERIGSVQSGIRPVVVVQNDVGNKYSTTVIGVPLTTKRAKRELPTHKILRNYSELVDNSIVLAEQIVTFDKTQIINYICNVREEDLSDINKKIASSLALEN